MSVSMRSTKAQLYSEVQRLQNLADKYQQQLRNAEDVILQLKATKQPSTQRHMPSDQRALAQFCASYCKTHGTRSVPGHVVHAWMAKA